MRAPSDAGGRSPGGPDDWFEADRGEPLALWTERGSGAPRELRFAYSSRGDRVPGRALLPAAGGAPLPFVLLPNGEEGAALDAVARAGLRAGAAVLCIDLPLHGARADAKLSRRLRGEGPPAASAADRALWLAFARQALVDLRRALDAAAALPVLDAERAAYAGFGLAAPLGAVFCALDPRPRAAALAPGRAVPELPELDPARYLARFAPRPLLLVCAGRGRAGARAAADALCAAAAEPKRVLHLDAATPTELPTRACEPVWQFLRRALGLAGPRAAEADG